MKKINGVIFTVTSLLCFCSCGGESNSESKHECNNKCPTCGKCMDLNCTDPACASKCEGHNSIPRGDFACSFVKDNNVDDIKVYTTESCSIEDTSGSYYARNKTTGEIDNSGEGQINFVITCKTGYEIDEVSATAGTYKNIKLEASNGLNYTYKITKITASTIINIKTKEKSANPLLGYAYNSEFNDQSNVALKDSDEFTAFWNYSSDIKIDLNFKENSFKTMCELQGTTLPKFADVYFPADLKIVMGNKTYNYEEVGVRLKGNTSRRSMLDNSGKITQAAHLKISLKATFDDDLYDKDSKLTSFKKTWADENARKERKDRNLFGMEKFDLKYVIRNSSFGGGWGGFGGAGSDGCYARELVAFDMFRREGQLAPHANIVQVKLDNEKSNKTFTYESIECVDKVFLKRHFSKNDAKGDLYKCGVQEHWIADFSRPNAVTETVDENGKANGTRIANGWIGVEDPFNHYFPSYQLKTNDDGENSDFSKMSSFINTIYDCLNNKGSKEELEKVIDIEQFLKYSAVSYMTGNFDDLRYNTNNSYLYFVPSTGKAVVIAYDYDWCLGLATMKDMSKVGPFDTYTMSNNISHLYKATILKDSDINMNLNYSKTDYQNKFLNYMKSALNDKCLDKTYLDSIFDQIVYKNSSSTEHDKIATYMENKTKTINDATK